MSRYNWLGDFLFVKAGVEEVCVGEVYHRHTGAWSWLLYADHGHNCNEELGEAATRSAAMAALKAADRLRRDGPGQPTAEVRDSAVSREGAVRPDGGVAAQPDSVESGASLLAEGVGQRRPVEGDRQPETAGAPPAPAAQPLPATSGSDSAPASVPPTDPGRASARSPEVVGSGALEAGWVALDSAVGWQPMKTAPWGKRDFLVQYSGNLGIGIWLEEYGRPVEIESMTRWCELPADPDAPNDRQPAPAGSDSAPASVPPTDPSRASARSPEVVGSGALEAGWVALGAWRACPSPGCVLRVDHDGEHRKWPEPYQLPLRSPAPENGVASDPTTRLDPPRLRGADPALPDYPLASNYPTSPGLGPADVVPPLQPAPSGGEGDCWRELIDALPAAHPLRQECEERRRLGIERYGQPLRRGDGRSASRDLRDELLDAAVYAWRLGYEDLALELIDTAQQWVGEEPYRFRGTEDVEPEDESRELRLDIAEWRRDRGVP